MSYPPIRHSSFLKLVEDEANDVMSVPLPVSSRLHAASANCRFVSQNAVIPFQLNSPIYRQYTDTVVGHAQTSL
jgi:hypothetical protein